jgi:hypothetical protein
MKTYKGIYKVKNPSKYKGDAKNVVYRSGWEQKVMIHLDTDPRVKEWSSEEVVIPYICKTDNRPHRYFMDFYVKYKDGRTVLIEVKPAKETQAPKPGRGKARQRVLTEGLTYIKNQSKWYAAKDYCDDRGWHFEIWTEHELRAKGLLPKPMGKKSFKPLKKLKPYKKPSRK